MLNSARTGSCPAGSRADAGRNTNRTSRTVGDGAAAALYRSCYDAADRLVSTTEPGVGAIAYDNHGNTTTIWGETRTYDATDRHTATTKGTTTVGYRRDPTGRIIARTTTGEPAVRYGFTGDTDSPDLVLDTAGTVTQRIIGLPGGALLTRSGGTSTWSLPNVHGDIVTTTDATGTPQGIAATYDAFGITTSTGIPDTTAGGFDYGWLGQHQRPTEHTPGLAPTIEMGARQYDPTLGRFLEVDPIEGGSANDYDYANADPRNQFDLDGNLCAWGCLKKKARKVASRAWKRTRSLAKNPWVQAGITGLACGFGGPVGCAAASAGFAAINNWKNCSSRRYRKCAIGIGIDYAAGKVRLGSLRSLKGRYLVKTSRYGGRLLRTGLRTYRHVLGTRTGRRRLYATLRGSYTIGAGSYLAGRTFRR